MTFHDKEDSFSGRFGEIAIAAIVDVSDLDLATLESARVLIDELEDYGESPQAWPGIYVPVLVSAYPEICPVTGDPRWSDWESVFHDSVGFLEGCNSWDIDLLPGIGRLPDPLRIAVGVEVCRGCIGPDDDPSNASPVFDNIQVCRGGLTAAAVGEPSWHRLGPRRDDRLAPNPLRPPSVLVLDVREEAQPVRVSPNDPSGREVATLLQGILEPGRHEVSLGSGALGAGRSGLGSGVDFLRIESPEGVTGSKLLVIR